MQASSENFLVKDNACTTVIAKLGKGKTDKQVRECTICPTHIKGREASEALY